MRPRRLFAPVVCVLILSVVACGSGEGDATTTTTPTPTTSPSTEPTTTTTATTTTSSAPITTIQGDEVTVLLAPFTEMGPMWSEQVFPYGDTEDALGTSPGGEGLMLGPEYGTQTPDGTWWFMDAAKMRIAHYSGDGAYLDQLPLPEDVLVDGRYFQYQNPQGLDDGTIVASGFRGEASTALLTISNGDITSQNIQASTSWVTTDGVSLFGFSLADGRSRSLDPMTAQPTDVDWFGARDGSRYLVRVDADRVVVELPDAGVTKTLVMRFSENTTVEARAGIEVETGVDGTLYILFYGAPMSNETLGIGGFVSIAPDGHVSDMEAIADPFSPADPGSPSHLGITPGTSTAWMMVVGEDGLHIYTRS